MDGLNPYEPAAARPRDRSRWLVLAWALLAVAITASAMTVAGRATSPADDLAAVHAFVAEHRSARFEGVTTETGEDATAHVRRHGEFVVPDRWHEVDDHGDAIFEILNVGHASYTRRSASGQWFHLPPTPTEQKPEALIRVDTDDGGATGFISYSMIAIDTAPDGLLRTLTKIGHVESGVRGQLVITYRNRDLLGPVDQRTLADTPGHLTKALTRYLDAVFTVVVEHGEDGRLDAIVVDGPSSFGTGRSHTETHYRDWGADIVIDAPAAGDIDPTPYVDEAELAAFEPGPLLAPTDLPSGWMLIGGSTIARDDDSEDCASATLDYGPGDAGISAEPTAAVTLVEPNCPFLDDYQPDLMTGPHARFGDHDVVLHHDLIDFFLYQDVSEGIGAALRVPQGWVLVATSEGEDVLARLVASLAAYRP